MKTPQNQPGGNPKPGLGVLVNLPFRAFPRYNTCAIPSHGGKG